MAERIRVPPGRAGRRWLVDRLATAYRAADLLDRKLRLLREERDRYQELARTTAAEWAAAYRTADAWQLRAALLCGGQELARCAPPPAAEVDVTWHRLMGLSYPAAVRSALPGNDPDAQMPGSAALVEAAAAARGAVRAAATHAAATAAVRALDLEVNQTRRRRRAIVAQRIPRLVGTLHDLTVRLDEDERAELVRLRLSARRPDR